MAVFPLPFTPFEYYYYSDDRPDYPTTFPVELRFSGLLDRERFLTALRDTIARHPLLRAHVDDRAGWPQWIDAGEHPANVDWADASTPIAPAGGEYLDLKSSTGLRTWVRADARGTRVLFQFHHACCDGLASLQFVYDLLAAYQNPTAPAIRRPLDPELLAARGAIAVDDAPPPSFWHGIRDTWYTVFIWASLLVALVRRARRGNERRAGGELRRAAGI